MKRGIDYCICTYLYIFFGPDGLAAICSQPYRFNVCNIAVNGNSNCFGISEVDKFKEVWNFRVITKSESFVRNCFAIAGPVAYPKGVVKRVVMENFGVGNS